MADWSLLQTPNFLSAALGGYQAGAALGKQKRLDAALGNFDLSNPATYGPVIQADPDRGIPLIDAGVKLIAQQRAANAGRTLGDIIRERSGLPPQGQEGSSPTLGYHPAFGHNILMSDDAPPVAPALGGGQSPGQAALGGNSAPVPPGQVALGGNLFRPAASASPSALDASDAAATPALGGSQPTTLIPAPATVGAVAAPASATTDPIVVSARKAAALPPVDHGYAEGMAQLAEYATPEQLNAVQDYFDKADKSQHENLADGMSALGVVGQTLKAIPETDMAGRQAALEHFRPMLLQHHLTDQQITDFVPTDQNIEATTGMGMGVEKMISAKQKQAEIDETARTHHVNENQGQQRVSIEAENAATSARNADTSAGQLGVSRARLGLASDASRSVTPSKVLGPILAKVAAGQALTPAENRAFQMYHQTNPVNDLVRRAMSGDDAGGGDDETDTPMPAARITPAARYQIGQTATLKNGKKVVYTANGWVQR